MKQVEAIIFDMDGCLYPLDRGAGRSFGESQFGQSIKEREVLFTQDRLRVDRQTAQQINDGLKDRHQRHLSLALEREHGIPRQEFFASTWDLQPSDYIDEQPELAQLIGSISLPKALLTAAPDIWAERVLDFLAVKELFGASIFCGQQDVRKPNPDAFGQIAKHLNIAPNRILSIGDQEHSDILPAQSLGMMTLRIGQNITTNADFTAPNITSALALLRNEGYIT